MKRCKSFIQELDEKLTKPFKEVILGVYPEDFRQRSGYLNALQREWVRFLNFQELINLHVERKLARIRLLKR